MKSTYYQKETTPSWIKLWHLNELTDEDFDRILSEVEAEFQKKEYKDVGIVKHVAGVFLFLADKGLHHKDKSRIVVEVKEYIYGDSARRGSEEGQRFESCTGKRELGRMKCNRLELYTGSGIAPKILCYQNIPVSVINGLLPKSPTRH